MTEQIEMKDKPHTIKASDLQKFTDLEIEKFSDDRGYKILTIVAENGQLDAVKYLIKRGDDVNREINGETAASVAFTNGHYDVVLALLHGNSKIPKNYNHEVASKELKEFVELSTKMHEDVKNEISENLSENIKKYPTVRHFYDLANNSLLKTAIVYKMFVIYELLLALNIFLAGHEDMNELLDDLSSKQHKIIREINLKLSSDLITEEMMILMRNCKLGPDTPEGMYANCMKIIREAFDFLFKIPSVSIILKVVAASRDFKIIFDFQRESVAFLDPSAEPYTNGLFYYSGRVYVAAKELLNPNTALENFGVIIHELCHYAMFLVYNNEANPYFERSLKVKSIFSKVAEECELIKDVDETVSSVFDDYPQEMHHAELIVRAPQMLVVYHNEKLYENFQCLIDFYQNYCLPRMEKELPNIELKFNPFKRIQRKVRLQRFWIMFLIISVVICSILGAVGVWYYYNPTISFDSLENHEKIAFKNSTISYHGVDVKVNDIYANDSKVFELIPSEIIKDTLKGNTKSLSSAIRNVYEQFVYLKWENMTEKLQMKFLEMNVRFQGQLVMLGSILFGDGEYLNVIEGGWGNNLVKNQTSDQNLLQTSSQNNESTFLNLKNDQNLLEGLRTNQIDFLSQNIIGNSSTDIRVHQNQLVDLNNSANATNDQEFKESRLYYQVIADDGSKNPSNLSKTSNYTQNSTLVKFALKNTSLELQSNLSNTLNLKNSKATTKSTQNMTEIENVLENSTERHKNILQSTETVNDSQNLTKRPQNSTEIKNIFQNSTESHKNIKNSTEVQKYLQNSTEIQANPQNLSNIQKYFQNSTLNTLTSISLPPPIYNALNSLTPIQIRNTFNDDPFNISSATQTTVEFFIKRYFVDSYIYVDENFYLNDTSIDPNNKNVRNADEIIENTQTSRIFLLSSVAGEGKSTAFRYFANLIKEKFKSRWVQFVDLKKYYKAYRHGKKLKLYNLKVLTNFLSEDLLRLKNLDHEVFKNLFTRGKMIFLWDGIDEVAPLYKDFMLELTETIKQLTKNIQFISTRPHHVKEFEILFSTSAYQLVPLGKLERSEMLVKFIGTYLELDAEKLWNYSKVLFVEEKVKIVGELVNNNSTNLNNKNLPNNSPTTSLQKFKHSLSKVFTSELKIDPNITVKIYDAIQKCEKIFHSIESSKVKDKQVTNPLLVQIISSVATDEDFDVKPTLNLYEVYEVFVTKKFRIILQKGEIALKDLDKTLISRTINVNVIHQAYAVKLLFGEFIETKLSSKGLSISDLNVMKSLPYLTDEEISRFGIVHVLHTEFNFVHRTFAEFFAAQFLFDSMLEGGLDPNTKDGKIKLFIILYINFFNFEDLVKVFLYEGISIAEKLSPTMEVMYEDRMRKGRNYHRKLDHGIFYLFKFMTYVKFFNSHYNISLLDYFVDDPIRFFNIHIVDDLVREWEIFEEIFPPEDFHFAVTGPLMGEGKILHQTCVFEADEVLVNFTKKLEQTLNKTEIANDIKANPRVFTCVARTKNSTTLKLFWEFCERNLDENEQKEFLRNEDKDSHTALDGAMLNKNDSSVFNLVLNIYRNFFTPKEILLRFNDEKLPIFYDFIKYLSFADNLKLSRFYNETFESLELRKLLSHRDKFGNSIFSFSEFLNENYENNSKIYEEILRETFESREEFEKFYKGLNFKSKLALGNSNITTFSAGDIYFLTHNWDEKYLRENSTILYDLGYVDGKHEELIVDFLTKLNESLPHDKIKSLLLENQNYFFKNLMKISKNCSFEVVEYFWEFLEEFLTPGELEQLLTTEDDRKWTFLEYSVYNTDHRSFNYVTNIYRKYLNDATVKEILQTLDSDNLTFIYSVIDFDGNFETVKKLVKYLDELFTNDKLKLRNVLSHRTNLGYTIFSYFKNFYHNQIPQKLKLFTELLKKHLIRKMNMLSF